MVAATGERPLARDSVTAINCCRAPGARSPGDDRGTVTEYCLGRLALDAARYVGAAATLAQAPGRAPVCLGDQLDDPREGDRVRLGAAERGGYEHAEQAGLDHRIDEPPRQTATPLDLIRGGCDPRRERARRLQEEHGRRGRDRASHDDQYRIPSRGPVCTSRNSFLIAIR